MVLVALHEIRDATGAARIAKHLLTRLRVLAHHLLLLFLLQLIVEGLELAIVGATSWPTKHSIDVLAKRYLWAETVHLVVVGVRLHTNSIHATVSIVEVGCLLYHAHATLIFSTIALPNRITLHLVNAIYRLNL